MTSVRGVVAGTSFVGTDAMLATGSTSRTQRHIVSIAIGSVRGVCGYVRGPSLPAGASVVRIAIRVPDPRPGVYAVPTRSADLKTFVGVDLESQALGRTESNSIEATTGSVEIITVTAARLTGRLDVSFGDGHLQGSFDARPCPR